MRCALLVYGVLAFSGFCLAETPVQFNRDVRPILSDRCFQCHGPNARARQADLRLDQADGPDGAYHTLDGSQVIKPGSIADSEIWTRLTSTDDDRMPPPDSAKNPLTADQLKIIKRWIEEGAVYTKFWAFVPPRKPALPNVDNTRWVRQPIDLFVLRKLNAKGLTPSPVARRRTLIRRLSLDLTGLPPTRQEIQRFLADPSADAYEHLVDRLLARPQYGEHMTKYWLDLVRFADTNGLHHDHFRDMSPYRDWVIRAFNQNLPYDKFVTYQLAGDLYPEPTRDELVASGFNRLHLIIDRGTALPEESLARNVIDRVTAVGTAFMGMTLQCAVCHDHKYDPITTKEFYQLYAFFNNLDGAPETGGRQGLDFERGLQPPYISLATETQKARLAELERRVSAARTRVKNLEQLASKAKAEKARKKKRKEKKETAEKTLAKDGKEPHKSTPTKDNTADKEPDKQPEKSARAEQLKQAKRTLAKAAAEQRTLELAIPMAMVMKERAEPRPAYIHIRGAYDHLGERVHRATPAFLPPLAVKKGTPTRMDLAQWFVSAKNPLTARVAVNRFWQQLFGVGIVKTAEDFGAQGQWPSHPDLLDYLAVTFVESGWDVKALVKQIVMSATYRQRSAATPERFERDPDNRLLARGSRFRMDAEMVRDQVLATSGLLNRTMYGKSVKPPQPPGLWKAVTMPSSYPRIYTPDTGAKIYRRSLYTFWKRGMPPPQMTILDAPTREACTARRERTNTPLQSLLLMNEPEYMKAARHLAWETLADRSRDSAARLSVLYETITSQLPDAAETKAFLKLVKDLQAIYRDHSTLADQLCQGVPLRAGDSTAELAAWTVLTSTIYNLDITKTRQ